MSNIVDSEPFFNPRQISGCQLWLDAADPNGNTIKPAEGSLVSSWSDKSGLGNNATAVGTITYRDNSMVYDTANGTYFLGNTSNTTNSLTLFTVCLVNTIAVSPRLFSASTANNALAFNTASAFTLATIGASTSLRAFRNNASLSVLTMPVGSSFIDTQLFDGTNNTHFLNGTAGTPVASTGNFNLLVYNVGSINGEQSVVSFNGRFQEVILYPSALNQGQREQVEGYLAWKWGLQSSLPANHPYRNSVLGPLVNPPTTVPETDESDFFSPRQISGCQLWLDAADPNTLILDGTDVSQWSDKSGTNNHATQTSITNRPVYSPTNKNLQFVRTSGDYLNLPNGTLPTGNNSYAYFIVCAWNQAIDGLGIIGGGGYGTNNAVFALRSFGVSRQIHHYWWNNDLTSGTNAYTVNVTLLVEATYTSGGARATLTNGNQLVTDNPSARAQTNLNNTLGASYITSPTPEYHSGTISEVIVYNASLTQPQREQVEGYLAWKWGLQSSLPANHPYRNSVLGPLLSPSSGPATMNQASWIPTNITGVTLSIWMDASDLSTFTLSGSNVTQWRDKSTAAYSFAPLTNNSSPVRVTNFNGTFPCVTSLTTTSILGTSRTIAATTINSASGISYFIVYQMLSGTVAAQFENTGVSGTRIINFEGVTFKTTYASTDYTNAQATTSPNISGVVRNVTNGTMLVRFNGSTLISSSTVTPATLSYSSGYGLFGQNSGTSGAFGSIARICEFVQYNGPLSTEQQNQIEGYLAWKWGLTGNLPASHPFKFWPPPPQ